MERLPELPSAGGAWKVTAKTPARARDRLVHSRPGAVGAHPAPDQADVA